MSENTLIQVFRMSSYQFLLVLVFSCVRCSVLYLWVEKVCVHHSSFDIVQVGVVFKSSLQQTCLLTQLSDVGTVIVCEHLVPQDRICYLKKFIHS